MLFRDNKPELPKPKFGSYWIKDGNVVTLKEEFPDFNIEDKVVINGGSIDVIKEREDSGMGGRKGIG